MSGATLVMGLSCAGYYDLAACLMTLPGSNYPFQ